MKRIQFLKESLEHRTNIVNAEIKKMLEVRNELQTELDKRAAIILQQYLQLFVKNLVANEPVSQVIVIGCSDSELDVDDKIYPYGVVDVKDVSLIDNDDYMTINADRICTLNENGEYVPVISKPFI